MASLGDRILRRELKTGGNNECGQHIVKLAHEINLLTDESPRQLLLSGITQVCAVCSPFLRLMRVMGMFRQLTIKPNALSIESESECRGLDHVPSEIG
jgi:hypothetical protein